MRNYYLRFDINAKINHFYLLCLYSQCQFNKATFRYDIIKYTSISNLSDLINKTFGTKAISRATLDRMLNSDLYKEYIRHDRQNKTIYINNNIKDCNQFVVITASQYQRIMSFANPRLTRYFLYQIYKCGYSKTGYHDTTIKQMLQELGISSNSNSNISLISNYNKVLFECGLINIIKYRDSQCKERNIYSINNC